jgi:hypothetical protein
MYHDAFEGKGVQRMHTSGTRPPRRYHQRGKWSWSQDMGSGACNVEMCTMALFICRFAEQGASGRCSDGVDTARARACPSYTFGCVSFSFSFTRFRLGEVGSLGVCWVCFVLSGHAADTPAAVGDCRLDTPYSPCISYSCQLRWQVIYRRRSHLDST